MASWCSVEDVSDAIGLRQYTQMTDDVADASDYVGKLIERSSAEVISYIKDVVEAVVWGAWTAATAPDEIVDAVAALTVCRVLVRRDTPMAPGTETLTQQRCREIREWLEKVKDGELELSVDMIEDETGGWQARIFGKDRKARF